MSSEYDGREIMNRAFAAYSRLHPRDRRDAEIHMSSYTAQILTRYAQLPGGEPLDFTEPGSALFGLTVRRDDDLAPGEVVAVVENEQDRAFRRAAAAGLPVKVVKMDVVYGPAFPPPPPPPSLKALLKHWLRR